MTSREGAKIDGTDKEEKDDPTQMIDNVELQKVAEAAEGQLKKVFDTIK